MRQRTVLRLAGIATIVGAAIDIVAPFVIYPRLVDPQPHLVYVAIDLLLTFGMLGVWSASRRTASLLGLAGLVLGLLGVMLVRTSSAKIFGEASYMIASSLWSIGMVVWGLDLVRAKVFRVSAGLWIAALVIGLVGVALKDHGPVAHVAKMSFILGFIVAGVDLIKARGEPA
jgi:zinc transporter ZupT